MTPYGIVTLDLSAAHKQTVLAGTVGAVVNSVYVVALPSAASIHFGGGQAWDLEQGKSYEPCPAELEGIAISNPLGAGLLVLALGFGEGGVHVRAASSSLSLPGFMAAQSIPPTAPAAPYHHFALIRNPPAPNARIIVLRSVVAVQNTAVVLKGQRAAALEAGAIVSTTALVQPTDPRLGDANIATFHTDPGNSTNGVGPATASRFTAGANPVALILTKPILLLPGDIYQVDEQDSTTAVVQVNYEYDQLPAAS